MILLYKILNNYFSSDFSALASYIPIQLLPPPGDTILNYSSIAQDWTVDLIRLINDWNNLPPFVVNANSVNSFKFLIDNYFLDSIDLNFILACADPVYRLCLYRYFNHNHDWQNKKFAWLSTSHFLLSAYGYCHFAVIILAIMILTFKTFKIILHIMDRAVS